MPLPAPAPSPVPSPEPPRKAPARPLDPAKRRQNAAFLRVLARTGNVARAATEAGASKSVFYRRRAAHPAFAQRWDAAQAAGQAWLASGGGRSAAAAPPGTDDDARAPAHRTQGGEPVVVRAPGGRLQVRRSHPGKLTAACEQAFLTALAATANIALSAAAAGASVNAFYLRRRHNAGFAREMRAALAQGHERIEMALIESWTPAAAEHHDWRHNEPPAMPAMTPAQALHLLNLRNKAERFAFDRPDKQRRHGETSNLHSARLARLYVEELARNAENGLLAQVLANDRKLAGRSPEPLLPALDQVTGWSRAGEEGVGYDPERWLGKKEQGR